MGNHVLGSRVGQVRGRTSCILFAKNLTYEGWQHTEDTLGMRRMGVTQVYRRQVAGGLQGTDAGIHEELTNVAETAGMSSRRHLL